MTKGIERSSAMIRLLLVDDDARIRSAWERFLGAQHDFDLIGTCDSAAGLAEAVEQARPDMVLVDLTMPGSDPLAAVAEATERCEGVRFVFYSGLNDEKSVQAAFEVGAWGFVNKLTPPRETLAVLRRIAEGEVVFPPNLLERS